MDIELLFTSGIASGVIVALTNYFITNKQLEKKMKEDREVLTRQYKQNVKLETYHYLIAKKMENIQNLHDIFIEKTRYNYQVTTLFVNYFNSKMPCKEMTIDEFNKIESKILSLELGSKLVEKEINFNLNYFPKLKEVYNNEVDFVKSETNLNVLVPNKIFNDFNREEAFKYMVQDYKKDVMTFRDQTLHFIELIQKEHENLIRQMEIDTN